MDGATPPRAAAEPHRRRAVSAATAGGAVGAVGGQQPEGDKGAWTKVGPRRAPRQEGLARTKTSDAVTKSTAARAGAAQRALAAIADYLYYYCTTSSKGE
eukprot:5142190-Prymnesium_polylepis.1